MTFSLFQLFRCEICGHSSSNRNYFTRHLLRHGRDSNNATVAGPDGFQCTVCSKTFQRRVHFDRHQRDVHGPQMRPHLCDICGKSFKRSDALQQHKVVHMSQASRTYQFHCSKCSKGFRSQVKAWRFLCCVFVIRWLTLGMICIKKCSVLSLWLSSSTFTHPPLCFWYFQPPDSLHHLQVPAPFPSSAPLHGMTSLPPFLSDRNPCLDFFRSNLKMHLFPKQ